MTIGSFLIFVIVGAIAGWLAGLIMKGSGFGLLWNIIVGILGGFFGGWLFRVFGIDFYVGSPIVTWIITAVIGAIVLLFIINLLLSRRK